MDMKLSLGEKISALRKEAGMSQEKVAECLDVSRQAVTKWENNISAPSTSNLIKLAELFHVNVSVLTGNENQRASQRNVSTGRTPWIFITLSFLSIIVYLAVSLSMEKFSTGAFIIMIVIFLPCQLFLHLYLSHSIKNDSMNGIAGYDERIEYNFVEVKKLFSQINLNIGMMSSLHIIILTVLNLSNLDIGWMNGVLVLLYVVNFIAVVMVLNYRTASNIYVHKEDEQKAYKSLPIVGIYLVSLFVCVVNMFIIFELKQIENNTTPALVLGAWLILGTGSSTIGFVIENYRINHWNAEKRNYRISFWFILCEIITVLACVCMFVTV